MRIVRRPRARLVLWTCKIPTDARPERVGSSVGGAVGTLHGTVKQLSDKIIESETHEKQTRETTCVKNCVPIKASDIDLENCRCD